MLAEVLSPAPVAEEAAARLAEAIELTEQELAAGASIEGLALLVERRAALLDTVFARASELGAPAAELALRLRRLDERLVASVWASHVDAYGWLRERDPNSHERWPTLAALAAAPPERTGGGPDAEDAEGAPDEGRMPRPLDPRMVRRYGEPTSG